MRDEGNNFLILIIIKTYNYTCREIQMYCIVDSQEVDSRYFKVESSGVVPSVSGQGDNIVKCKSYNFSTGIENWWL